MKSARVGVSSGHEATSLSICFPAYNEEATLSAVVRDAQTLLAPTGLEYEILVCDDGSADATLEILTGLSKEIPNLRVLWHPRNLGIRETFEHLYAQASMDYVFLNSTDGQWQTRVVLDLLAIAGDCDAVVTYRVNKHYGPMRALVSGLFNLVPIVLFGIRTRDAGSVKLVSKRMIEATPVISRSPFNEAERLIRAHRAGFKIAYVPVETTARTKGRSHALSWRGLLEACSDVARVWLDIRTTNRRVAAVVPQHQTVPGPAIRD